ncbi:glycoside hydrolase family 20 protein [Gonapodya prolifera JEL478]|uniref:beta-N-acetylhexosaminidase n=1 Tax=Gonapodya prolifera (strain JEL478) TaxID=1344416 RepID=A0A139AJC3_GONPJ|nr:glycoside hydrolase family 20 protein [Gonapodya prolifera JEL478]|eukprot:KXS16664.1 glycoside hydrolase family 20 protein [Gonapodya prolifera JEL478]
MSPTSPHSHLSPPPAPDSYTSTASVSDGSSEWGHGNPKYLASPPHLGRAGHLTSSSTAPSPTLPWYRRLLTSTSVGPAVAVAYDPSASIHAQGDAEVLIVRKSELRRVRRRYVALAVVALVAGAGCVGVGVWGGRMKGEVDALYALTTLPQPFPPIPGTNLSLLGTSLPSYIPLFPLPSYLSYTPYPPPLPFSSTYTTTNTYLPLLISPAFSTIPNPSTSLRLTRLADRTPDFLFRPAGDAATPAGNMTLAATFASFARGNGSKVVTELYVYIIGDGMLSSPNATTTTMPGFSVIPYPSLKLQLLSQAYTDAAIPLHAQSEAFALRVPSDGSAAVLVAESAVGAVRGVDTLSQLVRTAVTGDGGTLSPAPRVPFLDPSARAPPQAFAVFAAPVEVYDAPRFRYRGVFVDCARRFLPVGDVTRGAGVAEGGTLRSVVDGATWARLNVVRMGVAGEYFPLNITDARLRPLAAGAASPQEAYTSDGIKALVEYAADRGVRVVPSVEMPGGVEGWAAGWPAGVVQCEEGTTQLDLLHPNLPTILRALLAFFADAYIDPYVYVGFSSSRYSLACYRRLYANVTLERVRAVYPSFNATDSGTVTAEAILAVFSATARNQMANLGKVMVVHESWWSEGAGSGTGVGTEGVVLMVEGDGDIGKRAVKQGVKVVVGGESWGGVECGLGGVR